MSYTRSLSNTSVSVAKHLAIDSAFDEQTGHFYDNLGELVELDAKLYNPINAEKFSQNI
ncbi:Uncharacterised protein [Weissella viridescens]|uniref:Uncharacterized protein n=1 Tax=Weissella viridescens TaxID=1629 RepID=A0A380P0Z4_WEIVI|nr:Uncharacterised protein [Weissella viridescens]